VYCEVVSPTSPCFFSSSFFYCRLKNFLNILLVMALNKVRLLMLSSCIDTIGGDVDCYPFFFFLFFLVPLLLLFFICVIVPQVELISPLFGIPRHINGQTFPPHNPNAKSMVRNICCSQPMFLYCPARLLCVRSAFYGSFLCIFSVWRKILDFFPCGHAGCIWRFTYSEG